MSAPRRLLGVALAALACAVWQPTPAVAQQSSGMLLRCVPIAASLVDGGLAERYGEERRAVAVASRGSLLVEIFVNPQTGTWTLVLRSTSGAACVPLVGDGWEEEATGLLGRRIGMPR